MKEENLEDLSVSVNNPGYSKTKAAKVKEDIQKDVSQGEGSMTSREAGAMKD